VNELRKPTPHGDPAYLQIARQFKLLILRGEISNGEEVPSRRALAVQLSVNPMTVQKAFAELEDYGLIRTPPNAKSTVHADAAMLTRLRAEVLERDAAKMVHTAKDAGVSCDELIDLIKTKYGRPE